RGFGISRAGASAALPSDRGPRGSPRHAHVGRYQGQVFPGGGDRWGGTPAAWRGRGPAPVGNGHAGRRRGNLSAGAGERGDPRGRGWILRVRYVPRPAGLRSALATGLRPGGRYAVRLP